MKHLDYYIFVASIAIFISMANLFLFCYFGTMATESYERMAYCLYESSWIECPVHLQKYFIMMIRDMQQSLHYHGFGIVVLNLETFTTVCIFNSPVCARVLGCDDIFFRFLPFQMLNRTYTFYTLFKTIIE